MIKDQISLLFVSLQYQLLLLRCCKGWGQVGVARGEKQIREAIRIELYTKHDKHV